MTDTWSLRVFTTVAEQGSFSAAGERLLLTQPAVSRQVAGLERRLGVTLFRREPRGVTLTEPGRVAVGIAQGILARVDALEATMKTFAGLDGGTLRLAGFASVNTHFLPEAIHRFDRAHPAITVTLEQVAAFDALAAVREGKVDVALVTGWQLVDDPWAARTERDAPTLDVDDVEGVELLALVDEELRVAVPAGHRLGRRRRIPLAELRDERWVDGAPPDCLGPIPQLADALGHTPRIAFHCDDWNGKQALVAGGAGIMVVPTLAGGSIRPDVVLLPTTPALPRRQLYAAAARPPFRTAAATAMLDLLTEMAGEHRQRRR